ncbi:class I SAM-dependent methyltransferase [Streptomyces daliensis]|uniref:Class I SAM-dependent methyltransferase n=1 Tax=Streptomyces daliensis TaxID=299421 RepID=A0A8T4IUL2_9ACTN|nr:class I SAM-dependent methyltransferase [Streptomyces daliensis]
MVADAHRLPFSAGRFDLITCVANLPYLDAEPAARERAHHLFIKQAEGHHPRQDFSLARFTLPTSA